MTDQPTLRLGPDLELPADAVTRTIALLGQKRQGKSSTAAVIAEEVSRVGGVFATMDPTGAWWGLRSNAAGDGPGLDCVVMGGYHGDVPLDHRAGEVVARLVVVDGIKVVCDLERMTTSQQVTFVADFSEAAFHLCRRAVTIIYDEAWRFVPQSAGGDRGDDAKRCAGAVTDVVLLGGKKGLGSVLISQRYAKLHKDVMEQADVVASHRLMGTNDVRAVAEWFDDDEDPRAEQTVRQIKRLTRGRVALLAPEYGIVGTFDIRPKTTFDSSGTPEVGTVVLGEPTARSNIDLADLERRMGDALEAAREDDPASLRDRIRDLEAKIAAGGGGQFGHDDLAVEYEKGWRAGRDDLWGQLDQLRARLSDALGRLTSSVQDVAAATQSMVQMDARDLAAEQDSGAPARTTGEAAASQEEPIEVGEAPPPRAADPTPPAPPRRPRAEVPATGGADLSVGAARILAALAQRHPLRFSRKNVAALSQYKASGGAFRSSLAELLRANLLFEADDEFGVTEQGLALSGVETPAPPRTPKEALAMWLEILDPPEARTLQTIHGLTTNGNYIGLQRLAGALGMTATGGAFRSRLTTLTRNDLIERRRDGSVRLAPRATAVST